MIFINALLALGALAFTVPLAIHLLFRNRFEIIDWGAMRFLESVIRTNRRRMKLRNLLLLLVRCAIPILLAFCLARPILTGWKALPGNEPVSLVLALDTSYSLAAKVDPSSRRFDRMIATAEEIVTGLPRGSEVTLVTSSSVQSAEIDDSLRGDPQSTLTKLKSLRIGGSPLSFERLLSETLRKVSSATTERRQIVMLTDNAASDYSAREVDSFDSLGERRAAIAPAPSIAWVDAWQTAPDTLNNRRITKLEPAQTSSVPGQSVSWNVEARMDGELSAASTLDVHVDGAAIESKVIAFRSGIATITFDTVFEATGRHAIEIALPANDDFSADDRLRADFMVYPPLDVWLVDGNPSDKPLQSDTDFLAIALSPFSLAGEKAVDLFRTQRIGVRQLTSQKDLHPKIVVLADVGPMQSADLKWLQNFVEVDGGTLVLFAGPATDAELWDKQLLALDGNPLMPMKWGPVKSSNEGEVGAKIEEARLTYPPLASFTRDAKGTLAAVEVSSYCGLIARDAPLPSETKQETKQEGKPEADSSDETPPSRTEASVVMRLANGDPLIAVGGIGKGRVMQVATTANDRWTSLPRCLAFVPLMQRLFLHLATGGSRLATPFAGEPIMIDLPDLTGSVADGKSKDAKKIETLALTVTTPTGEAIAVQAPQDRIVFSKTAEAGVYRFESEDGRVAHSAVNVPAQDLKTIGVTDAVHDDAAKRIGATRYESVSAYQNDDSTLRFGRGIWRYMLMALLAAMIFEPILQQRGAKVTS